MHLTSVEHGVMAPMRSSGRICRSRVGGWRAQYKGDKDVSVCFFGDAHTNIGAFHEAAEFRRGMEAAAIFCCENNLYMEYTPIGDVTASSIPPRIVRRLTACAHCDRRQRRRRQSSRAARRLRQGARRPRAVADRVHDLRAQRALARRTAAALA